MKKHRRKRRRFCSECGGRIILARENEYYTATEPCCSKCGLVYEDEYFWHYIINGDDQPLLCGLESPKAESPRVVKAAPVAAGQLDTTSTDPAHHVGSDTFEQKGKEDRDQRRRG